MAVTQFEDPAYLEAVYAALFALLVGAKFANGVTLNTTARVVVPPDEVPAANQPAMFLFPGPLAVEQKSELGAARWEFTAFAIVYLRADSTAVAAGQVPLPATIANSLVWGLARAFDTAPPYGKQTLGGLVYHCWLDGEVVMEIQNEQVILALPIHILPGPYGG